MGTRWGSRQELADACQLAKQHGLDVLVDAVLNVSIYYRGGKMLVTTSL